MKLVHFVVLLAIAACAFPAGAVAQEFEVDTLGDSTGGGCVYECSLREAIETTNEFVEGPDKITFGVAGTIEPGSPLPQLEGEVEIDATTAPGWKGEPVVELNGEETFTEGGETWGLQSAINSKVRIGGLAIGGFYVGLWIGSENSAEICGNRIGTNLAGTAANPNWIGVEITTYGRGVRVGRNCPEGIGGNLISGNSDWGVIDEGDEVEIDQNLVGTDESAAAPLPNGTDTIEFEGGGGIFVTSQADQVTVGGIDLDALPHNIVAFNRGPGVLLGDDARFTTVRQNSIHSNTGLGIERESGTLVAEITSVGPIINGTTTVTGTVHGTAEHRVRPRVLQQRRMRPVRVRRGPVLRRQHRRRSRNRRLGRGRLLLHAAGAGPARRPFLHADRDRSREELDLGVLELRLGTRGRNRYSCHLLRPRRPGRPR